MKKFHFLTNYIFETKDGVDVYANERVYTLRMTSHETIEQYTIDTIVIPPDFIPDDYNYHYYSQLSMANQWRNLYIAWDKFLNDNQILTNEIDQLTNIINRHERLNSRTNTTQTTD